MSGRHQHLGGRAERCQCHCLERSARPARSYGVMRRRRATNRPTMTSTSAPAGMAALRPVAARLPPLLLGGFDVGFPPPPPELPGCTTTGGATALAPSLTLTVLVPS